MSASACAKPISRPPFARARTRSQFIDTIGISFLSVATFLAAFGLGFGQGLSFIAQNFVAGLSIVFQSIVTIGDYVEINGKEGEVVKIGTKKPCRRVRSSSLHLRVSRPTPRAGLTHLVLKPPTGTHITLPNSIITQNGVTNYNREAKMRVSHDVLVRHNEDIILVRQVKRRWLCPLARCCCSITPKHHHTDVLCRCRFYAFRLCNFRLNQYTIVCAKDDRVLAAPLPSVVVKQVTENGINVCLFLVRNRRLRALTPRLRSAFDATRVKRTIGASGSQCRFDVVDRRSSIVGCRFCFTFSIVMFFAFEIGNAQSRNGQAGHSSADSASRSRIALSVGFCFDPKS